MLVPQFRIMERRLWAAITLPSGVLATAFGFAPSGSIRSTQMPLWVKLAFVGALWAYMVLGYRILGECKVASPLHPRSACDFSMSRPRSSSSRCS